MKLEDIQRIQSEWEDYQKYFRNILNGIKSRRLGFDFLRIDKNIVHFYFVECWGYDSSKEHRIKISKKQFESPDIKKIIQDKVISKMKLQTKIDEKEGY